MSERVLGKIREFRTANFTVIVDAVGEECLDLSWDDDGRIADGLRSGEFVAFCARARVIHPELGEVASDYLGACIHRSIDEFQDHRLCGAETRKLRESGSSAICGSAFSDMVRTVCREARTRLLEMRAVLHGLNVREVAS